MIPHVPDATDTRDAPLDGFRVIDLSEGIAGPFCAKVLADFGADVVKVERPEGIRRVGWDRSPHPDATTPVACSCT